MDASSATLSDGDVAPFTRDRTIAAVRAEHGALSAGTKTDAVVRIAGRLGEKRRRGGLGFLVMEDETGSLQVMVSRRDVGDEAFADALRLDVGDSLGVEGLVAMSRTGELSVFASAVTPLAKTPPTAPEATPEESACAPVLDVPSAPPAVVPPPVRLPRRAVQRAVAAVVVLEGFGALVAHFGDRSRMALLVGGVLLVALGRSLARGRRAAWLFAVVLHATGVGLELRDGRLGVAALFGGAFVAMLILFRSDFPARTFVARQRVGNEERQRAEALVRRHGSGTLDYFSLRDDKSYFFSSDGEAMIAYASLHGYALVSGDPIGAAVSVPIVVQEFRAFCADCGWRVAFLGVRETTLPLYEALGMRAMYLGDEAVASCERLDLSGRKMRKLRQAVNHAATELTFELIRESDAERPLIGRLNDISARWRRGIPERGFGMTLSEDVGGKNPDILLAVARDRDGDAVAFLRFVPCYGESPGYSLDLMRRLPECPSGTTEFLVARTAAALAERGVSRLSLNFALWARIQQPGASLGALERVIVWTAGKLRSASARKRKSGMQADSLRTFGDKFAPDWVARSVVVEESFDFLFVWFLYAGVEGRFDQLPVIGRLVTPAVVAERGEGLAS